MYCIIKIHYRTGVFVQEENTCESTSAASILLHELVNCETRTLQYLYFSFSFRKHTHTHTHEIGSGPGTLSSSEVLGNP